MTSGNQVEGRVPGLAAPSLGRSMEAPPKKKIVAKVTANIYEPPTSNNNAASVVSSNLIRAKVSSSSVTRSPSVVNGTHSRNNSVTRTPTRTGTAQFDENRPFSPIITRASAPASTVGKSPSYGAPVNSLLLSPESSPSPTNSGTRQQPRIVVPQARKATLTITPVNNRLKANQSAAPTPISPPTSPRPQQLNYLSEPGGGTNLIPKRLRVTSAIRLPVPQIVASKPDGGTTIPTRSHSRNGSISSISGATPKPRIVTNITRAAPQQILSAPPKAPATFMSQSPPTSTISSRSSVYMNSNSLSNLSHMSYTSNASGGEDDDEEAQEQDESFEIDRVDTPQPEVVDEDALFAEEARSNRKMMDLEISNRSLLAVNTMLEATKLRQSREIKDLRRKLRETKHLPSKPLFTNKETLSPTTSDLSLPNNTSNSSNSSDEEEEAEPDPAYDRIVRLVEGLLSQAQRALERSIDDCMPAPTNTVKVLSAVEVQQYERRAKGLPVEEDEHKEEEDDDEHQEPDGKPTTGGMMDNDDDAGELADDDSAFKRKSTLFCTSRRNPTLMAGKPPD